MLNVFSLFSGIGGIDLGLESTGGFRTVGFCEVDPFCHRVLSKHWPEVPIFGDVRELDREYILACCERVDVLAGGFPCQPHSVAGKRKGKEDERHLWPEFARLVRELRPRWVLGENVPGIRSTAADDVLADLEAAGYSCWPLVVGADDVGAPHRRKRVWFVARLRLADRDTGGRSASLRCVLHDGERAAQRDDADRRSARPVGDAATMGRDQGEQAAPAGPTEWRDLPSVWPARPGEPQHEWEEPWLAYAERDGRHGREAGAEGLDADGPTAGRREGDDDTARRNRPDGEPAARRLELPLGASAHGLPIDVVRLARRANREALKAAGNSVVPQVVRAIGQAILEIEAALGGE
jgi:DNA (cytosine-5)-methyltransferase 1